MKEITECIGDIEQANLTIFDTRPNIRLLANATWRKIPTSYGLHSPWTRL